MGLDFNSSKDVQRYIHILIGWAIGVVVVLLIMLAWTHTLGRVDIGGGIKITKAEFNQYLKLYEEQAKNTAFEMISMEKALKEEGITVSEAEIQEAKEKYNQDYATYGEELTDQELYINSKVIALSEKAIDRYKEDVDVTDDEINKYVGKQNEYSLVAGDYKRVSDDDSYEIENNHVSFDDIDDKYDIKGTGTRDDAKVDNPEDIKVGDVVYSANEDGTTDVIKVTSIVIDGDAVKENIKDKLKEEKAVKKFDELIDKVLGTSNSDYNELQEIVNEGNEE